MTESAPATNRPRRYRSPCLLILPSLFLPPLECCFGTIPIQAEKLRPDRKDFGSATVATTAVASTGPTPGASSSLMLISLDRCQALISRSNSSICSLILRNCAPNADRHARAISGTRLSFWIGYDIEQLLDPVAPDRCN